MEDSQGWNEGKGEGGKDGGMREPQKFKFHGPSLKAWFPFPP